MMPAVLVVYLLALAYSIMILVIKISIEDAYRTKKEFLIAVMLRIFWPAYLIKMLYDYYKKLDDQ